MVFQSEYSRKPQTDKRGCDAPSDDAVIADKMEEDGNRVGNNEDSNADDRLNETNNLQKMDRSQWDRPESKVDKQTNGTELQSKDGLESSSSEDEDDDGPMEVQVAPESPEGGWGWVVVFGAFVVYWLVPGMIRSYGALYIEVLETFPDSTDAEAGWIPALLSSISIGLAPISAVLGKVYTCRNVVFVGGLLCSIGLSLSYFATSLYYLYVTIGLITGIGAGLCTTPSVIVINSYFVRKRALASGVCVSGAAVGSFTIPIFVKFLVGIYSFRGTLLIMGAVILHVCACSLLFTKDGIWTSAPKKASKKRPHVDGASTKAVGATEANGTAKPATKLIDVTKFRTGSLIQAEKVDNRLRTSSLLVPPPSGAKGLAYMPWTPQSRSKNAHGQQPLLMPRSSSFTVNNQALNTKILSSSLSHSVNDIGTASVFTHHNSLCESDSDESSGSDSPRKSMRSKLMKQIKGFLKMCLDFTLFREVAYVVTVVSGICISGAFPHVLFFVPSFATSSLGVSKVDAGMLLSICSGVDLISRIAYGWFMDLHIIRRSHGLVISCAVCGIGTCCIPLSNSYPLLAVSTSLYGFGSGTCFMLLPVILADNHGVEKLPSTYGLMRLFQGFFMVGIAPFAGMLKDTTGSFAYSFVFMGLCMLLAAITMLFMPCAQRRDEKKLLAVSSPI